MSPRWEQVAGHTLWFYVLEEHQRQHVAVRGEHRATIGLRTGDVLAGICRRSCTERCGSSCHEDAMEAWRATQAHELLGSIDQ